MPKVTVSQAAHNWRHSSRVGGPNGFGLANGGKVNVGRSRTKSVLGAAGVLYTLRRFAAANMLSASGSVS